MGLKKQLCLACLVSLAACSRRPHPPEPTRAAAPALEIPQSQPLKNGPPPPRPPAWKIPDFPTPDLRAPDWKWPEFRVPRQPGPWEKPSFDTRFDQWHWQSFAPHSQPRLRSNFDLEFDTQLHLSPKDVFRDLAPPKVGDLRSALDDYAIQQQALRDKYIPFPIPVSLPIPF